MLYIYFKILNSYKNKEIGNFEKKKKPKKRLCLKFKILK